MVGQVGGAALLASLPMFKHNASRNAIKIFKLNLWFTAVMQSQALSHMKSAAERPEANQLYPIDFYQCGAFSVESNRNSSMH